MRRVRFPGGTKRSIFAIVSASVRLQTPWTCAIDGPAGSFVSNVRTQNEIDGPYGARNSLGDAGSVLWRDRAAPGCVGFMGCSITQCFSVGERLEFGWPLARPRRDRHSHHSAGLRTSGAGHAGRFCVWISLSKAYSKSFLRVFRRR